MRAFRCGSSVVLAAAAASLLSIATELAQAADKPVKMADTPKPVQKTMAEQSKNAQVVGVLIENEGGKKLYELETVAAGRTRDLLIDPEGRVVEIEAQVDLDSLPAALQDSIRKQSSGGKVTKIESVTKGDDEVIAYDIQVKTGNKTRGFRLAPDGKPLPEDKD
jgi:uncharacterized membrane protein YkoI